MDQKNKLRKTSKAMWMILTVIAIAFLIVGLYNWYYKDMFPNSALQISGLAFLLAAFRYYLYKRSK